jgi:hypothetical protein
MIWNRISILAGSFGFHQRRDVAEIARRWSKAMAANPELRADLIRLGGVMAMEPRQIIQGTPEVMTIDPLKQAYDAGRRDFALQLLALSGLTHVDMNILMESDDA